jgi:hypothetical protein
MALLNSNVLTACFNIVQICIVKSIHSKSFCSIHMLRNNKSHIKQKKIISYSHKEKKEIISEESCKLRNNELDIIILNLHVTNLCIAYELLHSSGSLRDDLFECEIKIYEQENR